jgi:hypothetical protein
VLAGNNLPVIAAPADALAIVAQFLRPNPGGVLHPCKVIWAPLTQRSAPSAARINAKGLFIVMFYAFKSYAFRPAPFVGIFDTDH